jgi:glycosyltransferase involved in cell wall biosynthesis
VFGDITRRRRWLDAEGISSEVWTPLDFPALGRWKKRWWPLVWPSMIDHRLRSERFDLVIHHSWTGASRRPPATPTVVQFHGLEPLYQAASVTTARMAGTPIPWRHRLLQKTMMPWALRQSCRRASLVLCLNGAERSFILGRGWAPAERIVVTAHSIENEFFVERPTHNSLQRLAFIGQWLDMKGKRELVEAFSLIAALRPETTLALGGVRASAGEILQEFPEPCRQRVTVHPTLDRDEVRRFLARADVFLFPSHWEAWGLAPLEACAASVPLVATPVGFIADHLRPAIDYTSVPPRNSARLVEVVDGLLAHPDEAGVTAASARERVEKFRESEVRRAWLASLLPLAGCR